MYRALVLKVRCDGSGFSKKIYYPKSSEFLDGVRSKIIELLRSWVGYCEDLGSHEIAVSLSPSGRFTLSEDQIEYIRGIVLEVVGDRVVEDGVLSFTLKPREKTNSLLLDEHELP